MNTHPQILQLHLHNLIHEVASRTQLLSSGSGEVLDMIRDYIKGNPDILRSELRDMALAASQGKAPGNLRNLLIKRCRDLGLSLQESKDAVDKWQNETLG